MKKTLLFLSLFFLSFFAGVFYFSLSFKNEKRQISQASSSEKITLSFQTKKPLAFDPNKTPDKEVKVVLGEMFEMAGELMPPDEELDYLRVLFQSENLVADPLIGGKDRKIANVLFPIFVIAGVATLAVGIGKVWIKLIMRQSIKTPYTVHYL